MRRTYEALFILKTSGKEENSKELIEKVEKEIQLAGGEVVKIERMDKRPFARVAQQLDSGYFVNIGFQMTSQQLDALQNKLKLDDDVFRMMALRTKPSSSTEPRAVAKAA